MGKKRDDTGTRRNGETEIRGQRSDVRNQRTEDRRQRAGDRNQKSEEISKGFSCGSGFPRPACPGRSPGEPVEGQPRSCALNDFNDLPFTAYR